VETGTRAPEGEPRTRPIACLGPFTGFCGQAPPSIHLKSRQDSIDIVAVICSHQQGQPTHTDPAEVLEEPHRVGPSRDHESDAVAANHHVTGGAHIGASIGDIHLQASQEDDRGHGDDHWTRRDA
jgi:hypothetical protein